MDKISGIIPANSRITTVDMKNSAPVRSGVPSFGRDVVETSNHRAMPKSMLDEVSWMHNKVQEQKESARSKSAMVSDLADKFFNQKVEDIKVDSQVMASPQDIELSDPTNVKGQKIDLYA